MRPSVGHVLCLGLHTVQLDRAGVLARCRRYYVVLRTGMPRRLMPGQDDAAGPHGILDPAVSKCPGVLALLQWSAALVVK
jgi:hypothetical protein